jgi:hypothetical protein
MRKNKDFMAIIEDEIEKKFGKRRTKEEKEGEVNVERQSIMRGITNQRNKCSQVRIDSPKAETSIGMFNL